MCGGDGMVGIVIFVAICALIRGFRFELIQLWVKSYTIARQQPIISEKSH